MSQAAPATKSANRKFEIDKYLAIAAPVVDAKGVKKDAREVGTYLDEANRRSNDGDTDGANDGLALGDCVPVHRFGGSSTHSGTQTCGGPGDAQQCRGEIRANVSHAG